MIHSRSATWRPCVGQGQMEVKRQVKTLERQEMKKKAEKRGRSKEDTPAAAEKAVLWDFWQMVIWKWYWRFLAFPFSFSLLSQIMTDLVADKGHLCSWTTWWRCCSSMCRHLAPACSPWHPFVSACPLTWCAGQFTFFDKASCSHDTLGDGLVDLCITTIPNLPSGMIKVSLFYSIHIDGVPSTHWCPSVLFLQNLCCFYDISAIVVDDSLDFRNLHQLTKNKTNFLFLS